MKIGGIYSYQSFKANDDSSRSFMGRVSDGITDAFDTTAKATENISDLVKSTKNAMATPGEATIGILTDQIEDKVVKNEDAPNWLRKTATYGTALLAAGGTFIAVRKIPGAVKNFTVKTLSKTDIGSSILTKCSSVKKSVSRIGNALGAEHVKNAVENCGAYLSEHFPRTTKTVKSAAETVKLDKLKEWSVGDYLKNAVATILGYQTGKKVINKYQDSVISNEPPIASHIAEEEIDEAA